MDNYALAEASTGVVSTAMPGPMVDEIYAPLMYLPLAAAGLALITADSNGFDYKYKRD